MTTEQMTPEEEARLRLAAGISPSTPTEYMLRHIPLWVKMSILRRNTGVVAGGGGDTPTPKKVTTYDFTTNTYRKNGSKISLGDVSEFIRLSYATIWQDGNLVEVGNNIPRIGGDGLLIEKSATELIPNNSTITSNRSTWTATSKPDTQVGDACEFVSDGSTPVVSINTPLQPNGNVIPNSGYYYRGILAKKTASDSFLTLGSASESVTVVVNLKSGSLESSGSDVVESRISDINGYYLIETLAMGSISTMRRFTITASNSIDPVSGLLLPTVGHKVTIALPSFRDTTYFPQSVIMTSGTQTTRSPDILNIPILPSQTLTGDWDEGITHSLAGGIVTFAGHGYVRNITVEEL